MKYLPFFSLALAIIATALAIYLYLDLRQLKCDLVKGTFAERQYTYPILRDLGKDPDDYGKDVLNPITTSDRYAYRCEP
jgi:hypothetical protein